MVALLADHRADERNIGHDLGEPAEPLGQLDPLDRGGDRPRPAGAGGTGVRIERFELARSAGQPEQDDRPRRFAAPLGLCGQQMPDRRQPAQARQAESRRNPRRSRPKRSSGRRCASSKDLGISAIPRWAEVELNDSTKTPSR